ncbi:MAG: MATE family efflux transporter [Myxococcales bacterium]|jgi:putative MATE family efflux protein|nr:MATE family efflux transporter [Myxococcales bacterium]
MPSSPTTTTTASLLNLSAARVVWRVALPATASFMLNTCFNLIDAFFVGKLGTDAMASLSSASIFTWILYSIGSLGQVGGQTLVSQALGAGDTRLAKRSILAALALHLLVALAVLLPLFFFHPAIFGAMDLTPEVARGAGDYLRPFLAGMFFYFPGMVAMAAFHAHGDTRTPALLLAAALGINAILDPIAIHGLGPIPGFGLWGAGVSTAICKVFFSLGLLFILWRRGLIDPNCWRLDAAMGRLIQKVAAIGLPIALNGAFFSGVYLALIRILSSFGMVPVATLGIVHRLENLGWFACVGFGVAGAALAGQLTGAARTEEARRKIWQLTLWLSAILLGVSILYLTLSAPMIAVFTEDPAVIAEGVRYLSVIAIFSILMGWEAMFEEALSAVGASKQAFFIATPLTLLRIPVAWFFAMHLGHGIAAVWWTIAGSTALKGVGLALCFTFGRWRQRQSIAAQMAMAEGVG